VVVFHVILVSQFHLGPPPVPHENL